jgi:hypothetical protein
MTSKIYTTDLLFACVALALLITACSRTPKPADPKPGTPEAAAEGERFMRSMSDTLARAKAFSFETSERFESSPTGGEKRVQHFTRKVTVRRPNGLFFELHEQGNTVLEVAAYYDGQTLTLSKEPDMKWAQTTVPSSLDEMLDDVARRFGLPVPIGDVVYSSPYDAFIGSSTRGGLVGRETIDDVPCVKLDYADALLQLTLWLPTSGLALPQQLEIVYKRAATPLAVKLKFTRWKLDVPVTDEVFAFRPPQGYAPVEFGDLAAGLLAHIIPAERQAASPATAEATQAGGPAAR